MRSAADADVNIGLSKSHPYVHVELLAAREIDSTVDDNNRSGLPAALRDLTPSEPIAYVSDMRDPGYDATDPRHANVYGAGHHDGRCAAPHDRPTRGLAFFPPSCPFSKK